MRRRLLTTAGAAALVALGAAACERDPPGDPPGAEAIGVQERDSAGVRIVENERPSDESRLGWRIGPEPSASIGVVEGEEPYMLHQVGDATRLRDGRIVVANGASSELRVFDEFGIHLATWGRAGDGPGEFVNLLQVDAWPGDSIVAWFSQGRRFSIFDSDGRLGRSFSLRSEERVVQGFESAGFALPLPQGARGNGSILTVTGATVYTATVEVWDGAGSPLGFLGTHPATEVLVEEDGSDFPQMSFVAYGRTLVTALWGDLVVVGSTSRYEIRAFGEDGALARIVRRDHDLRAPTEADLDAYVDAVVALDEGRRGERMRPDELKAFREDLEASPLAETFPAFTSVMGDGVGHLWVREYDFPGEERPAPLWTVFDPAGRILGFVETPKELTIFEIGEDWILGRTADELGVQSIQLWPLERR